MKTLNNKDMRKFKKVTQNYELWTPNNFDYLLNPQKLSKQEALIEFSKIESTKEARLFKIDTILQAYDITYTTENQMYVDLEQWIMNYIYVDKPPAQLPAAIWLSLLFDIGLLVEAIQQQKYPTLKTGVVFTKDKRFINQNRRVLYGFKLDSSVEAGLDLSNHLIIDYGIWFLREGKFRMPLKAFVTKYIDKKMQ